MISIIVAVAKNGVIGKGGETPWYLPADLAHFKQKTMGHSVVMGRKTHESIGRALPGRYNIVITRNLNYKAAESCIVADSLENAIKIAKAKDKDEIFVIGGESIYRQALPLADRIYLTRVKAKIHGDKFFKYDPSKWKEVSGEPHKADDKNRYDFEFVTLERQRSKNK